MQWFTEFSMREWLIVCGIALVLIVLIDGFRRMYTERKSKIKMSAMMGGGFPEGDIEEFGTELPNGGGRVVSRENLQKQVPDSSRTSHSGFARSSSSSFEQDPLSDGLLEPSEESATNFEALLSPELIIFHVKSNDEKGFQGKDLLEVLLACDLRYGDKDILHRHEKAGGMGSLQFSVANMVEPGIFKLEEIASFTTPGVTFFMMLPGPDDPVQAFECMIETANCLVKNLNATLYDESHKVVTPSCIANYKKRVNRAVSAAV